MKVISRLLTAGALLALAGPAAAQESEVLRHLDVHIQHIQQHAELMARAFAAQSDRAEQRREAARRRREAEQRRREERRAEAEARSGPEVTEQFSRTVRLGRDGTFDLENISGEIVIAGGGGDDVRIDAIKRARHPDEATRRQLLQEIQIQVAERNGYVQVRTDYPRQPRRRNSSGSVDYKVLLPRTANVTLRNISGDVRVENVNGELRAETISGGLVTTGARRVRAVKSVSGNIEISDTEGEDITASTISGNVTFRNAKVRTIDLQSVSGNVRFEDIEAARVNLRSFSGDIDYRGPLLRSGRYEFQTQSGDVHLTPVRTDGFIVEATTFSGDVRSDFALTLQGGDASFGPRRMNRAVRGSFGNAGATISLQSFSGDLVIAR